MKSLKERLADKAARQAIEDAKLSGPVKSYRFSLPLNGSPYISKQSDVDYVKARAFALVKKLRTFSPRELYDGLKDAINAEEKRNAERLANRSWWSHEVATQLAKYIVVIQTEDGTLKDEHGNVYRKDSPTVAPDPKSLVLNSVEEGFRQRLEDIERRTRRMTEAETPTNVTDAQQLLDDANNVEADLQEVLRDLEKETAANPEGIQVTITDEGGIEPLTEVQQALNQAMNDLELTPEQEDVIIQPAERPEGGLTLEQSTALSQAQTLPTITEIRQANGVVITPTTENLWGEWLRAPPNTPLPGGLTFPMDLVTCEGGTTPAVNQRSARRRRNIIRRSTPYDERGPI